MKNELIKINLEEDNLINNNNKENKIFNKLQQEERKSDFLNSKKYLLNRDKLKYGYKNLILDQKRDILLNPIFPKYYNRYNNSSTTKSIFNKNIFNDISKDKSMRNNGNIKIFSRNSSYSNLLSNNKLNKISFNNRYLLRNNSTSGLLNKTNEATILPLIKPRKILINICSGPFELLIDDLNKNYFSFKKFGKNAHFMGEKYSPDNYGIIEKNRLTRNYYGAIFAN